MAIQTMNTLNQTNIHSSYDPKNRTSYDSGNSNIKVIPNYHLLSGNIISSNEYLLRIISMEYKGITHNLYENL